MSITIKVATATDEYEAFGSLCVDYIQWCRQRYESVPWLTDEVFGHQAIDEELKGLSLKYGPPKGKTLIVRRDGDIVAGGAYRWLSPGVAELKRLYVQDRAQGMGIGRRLCEALIQSAKDEGATLIRLDTGNLLTEAIALYRSMGFETCPSFHDYPERFLPYLVFMEKKL